MKKGLEGRRPADGRPSVAWGRNDVDPRNETRSHNRAVQVRAHCQDPEPGVSRTDGGERDAREGGSDQMN